VNLPNLLTLSRIPILFGIVGLLYLPVTGAPTAALLLFIAGAATDWLDGYVARKRNQVSDLGKLMDALTDKVFMVGLFVTFLAAGILPAWSLPLLLLVLTREFLITGLRLVAAASGTVLAAEKAGKHKTVSQIVCAVLLLAGLSAGRDWRFLFPEAFGHFLSGAGVVFFVLATLLTVSSGAVYLAKYWRLFLGEEGSKRGQR
jgi:CDP-diacylglycerol--glycerol-3-phosphate 3-phosphatidyltransferase